MSRFLCILFCLLSFNSSGSDIHVLEDKARKFSAKEVYEIYKKGNIPVLEENKLNAGLTSSVYWLFVKINQNQPDNKLVIGNSHINRIDFFKINDGQPGLAFITGDHYPFRQRLFKNPLFVFPLQQAEAESIYLLRIDKHDESLQLTAELISEEELYKRTVNENLINGILWGILLLIIIFGIFLFISVKDTLYLYYVLYILMAGLWVITDKGYGYQFLWPESPYFASRARLLANFFFIISMIQFMQAFIGQKKDTWLFKPLKAIQLFNLLFSVMALAIPYSLGYINNLLYGFLIIHLFLDACTIILIVLSVAEKIKENNQQAWFYMVSVVALLAFILAEIFVQAGITNANIYYLRNYGVQTGIVVEAIILNFGLAHRFNQYKNEKEHLLIRVNQKQQELTGRIIETQEAERKKIADQLHDEVGSMLSLASIQISSVIEHGNSNISTKRLQKAVEVLNSVTATIRNMSHTLTPLAIEKYGFKNAITDLVKTINLSGKLQVEYIVMGFEDTSAYSSNLLNDLYRIIKELMNNVLKHSEATHCLIQLIEHEDSLSILVEDNGKGMGSERLVEKKGMGLNNIRSKIDYFNGLIEVSEKNEGGTLINIEIPLKYPAA